MSIMEAFEKEGITEKDFEGLLKIKKVIKNGNSAEVKQEKDGSMKVYYVGKKIVR